MYKKLLWGWLAIAFVIVGVLSPTHQAQAGIFDWLKTKIIISQNSPLEFKVTADDYTLPFLQSNSLIAASVPMTFGQYYSPAKPKKVRVLVSAYSSTVDQTDSTPFITASGTHVRDGIVATNFLPMGTIVRIPELYGDKIFIVEDRMNQRYYYHVDIWFPTREEAKEFGVKEIQIEIVS